MAQVASRGLFRPADQLHLHPVVMVGVDVAEQHRRAVDGVDDHIDLAVVEEVAKGRSASGNDDRKPGAFHRRNVFEPPLLAACGGDVMEQQRPLGKGGAPVVLVDLGDRRGR